MHHPVGRILFTLLWLTVSGLAHALVVRWALRFEWARQRRRLLYWVAGALVVSAPLARVTALLGRTDWTSRIYAIVLTETTLVVLAVLPLAVALGLAHSAASLTERRGDDRTELVGRRRLIEGAAGAVALGVTASAFGWGLVRGRHALVVEEVEVRIPGLPRVLDGYTIAQISDLHVGPFVGERELKDALALVERVQPDLLVATGDLVDFDARCAPLLARLLSGVRARDGVVAVPGNHDYYSGVREVTAALQAAGIELLLNAGKRIRPSDGGGFALIGVDDLWGGRSGGPGPNLGLATSLVPPDVPRILLAHQPEYFEIAAGRVALQLSGHTHGGQINPGFRVADLVTRFVAGRYEKAGSTLWVNRGIGTVGPPARLGAPPEVTRVVLVSA